MNYILGSILAVIIQKETGWKFHAGMEDINTAISDGLMIVAISLVLILLQSLLVNRIRRKRAYVIEPGGTQRIVIDSSLSWRKAKVYFDGVLVRTISSKREFLTSQEFQLPDRSTLRIKLTKVMFSYFEVQMWRNGEPLHNFEHLEGPLFKITNANGIVAVVGILPLVWILTLLLLCVIFPKHFYIGVADLPVILPTVIWGVLFLVLAYFGQKKSMIALFLATAIYTLDAAIGTLIYVSMGYALIGGSNTGFLGLLIYPLFLPWGIGFFVIHIIFLVVMIRGCAAIIAIKKKENSPLATGVKALVILAAICGIAAALYWAMVDTAAFSTIEGFYSQMASPFDKNSRSLIQPDQAPQNQSDQTAGICWTFELKEFDGNRSQVWEKMLDDQTRHLLPFEQFKEDVIRHNSQLAGDGYIFYHQKTYQLPERCP